MLDYFKTTLFFICVNSFDFRCGMNDEDFRKETENYQNQKRVTERMARKDLDIVDTSRPDRFWK